MRPGRPLPPPASLEVVYEAVTQLGFPLPPLLPKLWVEIANGGFGPGYGLLGVDGGHATDGTNWTVPDAYLESVDDPGWAVVIEGGWPKELVQICDWGCGHMSAIDCSTSEGEIVDYIEGYVEGPDIPLRRRGVTFAGWMEQWVNGARLWR
jgi:hypothetical protein